MKTLVISKPVYDYILPLVEFPQDGNNFYIDNSLKTLSNIGTLCAITLGKYGMDVSFTGMIGEDETGRKIKEILESFNIDTKYIETSYTERTEVNYKIYNSKTNKFTTISEKSIKNGLTKYKYEFIPDVVVMDDGDYSANLAAINNYPNSKLIYIGEKFTKDSLIYCNKCNYIITTINFASQATGVTSNLNKPKNVVSLFQKFIDLFNANLIIKLNNFDILYCVNDEVRLIKNVNKNIANKDNLFYSILTYFLINTNDIENSIKLTNKVMLESSNDLDMIKNIPDYKIVKESLENINNVVNNLENNVQNQVNNTEINNNSVVQTNNEPNNITNENNISNVSEQINNITNTEVLETPKLENINNTTQEGVNDIEKL